MEGQVASDPTMNATGFLRGRSLQNLTDYLQTARGRYLTIPLHNAEGRITVPVAQIQEEYNRRTDAAAGLATPDYMRYWDSAIAPASTAPGSVNLTGTPPSIESIDPGLTIEAMRAARDRIRYAESLSGITPEEMADYRQRARIMRVPTISEDQDTSENDFSAVQAMADAARNGTTETPAKETKMGVKKYTEQTLQDIKIKEGSFFMTKKYKPLPDASDNDNKALVVETLDYIESVAQSLNIPVTNIKMIGTFTVDDRLLTDKTKINEKLIKLAEGLAAPEWRAKSLLGLTTVLAKNFADSIGDTITEERDNAIIDVEHYHTKIEEGLRKVRELNIKYGDLEAGQTERIEAQLKSALEVVSENPFYTFIGFNKKHMRFLTQPIDLRDYNPAANLDLTLNLGSMVVEIPFSCDGDYIHVYRGENTIESSHWHPHVNSSGSVCWGNAANLYQDLLLSGDMGQLLTIMQQLLCTYNRESPYKALSTMAIIEKDSGRRATPTHIAKGLAVTEEDLANWDAKVKGSGTVTTQVTKELLESWSNIHFNERPMMRMKNHWMRNYEKSKEDRINREGGVVLYANGGSACDEYDSERNCVSRDTKRYYTCKSVCGRNASGTWRTISTCHIFPEMLEIVENELEQHPLFI